MNSSRRWMRTSALALLVVLLSACGGSSAGQVSPPTDAPQQAAALTSTRAPTSTRMPTQPPAATALPTATRTPTPAPTPLGGALGGVLFIGSNDSPEDYGSHTLALQRSGSASAQPVGQGIPGIWAQSISPDGKTALISVSDTPVRWDNGDFSGPHRANVFSFDLASGLFSNLSDADSMDVNPSWSPDSLAIAYAKTQDRAGNIFRVNADGTGATQLTYDGISFSPEWSPDGQSIAFIRRYTNEKSHVYLMAADGSNPRQLTAGEVADAWMENMVWSPDGQHLAFSRAVFDPRYPAWADSGAMVLINMTTGELTEIDNRISKAPAWSPDGSRLAFSTGDYCIPCDNSLVVYDLISKSKSTLVEYSDKSINNLGWSPDGRMIHYEIWQASGSTTEYTSRVVEAQSGKQVAIWDRYRFLYWLPQPVAQAETAPDCPAGPSKLTSGGQAILAADRPTNPLRAFPGRKAFQVAEIQQGDVFKLITRACAPERIYWLVQMPDGKQGWTAEGDGKSSWVIPYTGQALPPTPTREPTPAPGKCANKSEFVADVTIPDYTKVEAGATFTKTWRIKNSGTCAWNPQYTWRLVSGDAYEAPVSSSIDVNIAPGELLEISVEIKAPSAAGTYTNSWQLHDPDGSPFGTKPVLVFVVP